MVGRKPLAPEVHRQQGTYRHDPQRENKNAPVANGNAPEMPEFFNDDETRKWGELVSDLTLMGIMSSDCREIMIAYCCAYGGWMRCRRAIAAGDDDPKLEMNLHKYRAEMNRLLPEFGLTPSSRGKLVAFQPEKQLDGFEQMLSRLTGNN